MHVSQALSAHPFKAELAHMVVLMGLRSATMTADHGWSNSTGLTSSRAVQHVRRARRKSVSHLQPGVI